jgi:hypothetical protein
MSMLFCYWGFVAVVALVLRFIVLPLKEAERKEQQRLKKKQQDQEAYTAFHERERENSLVMRVVSDVDEQCRGNQPQTYEVWRLRWRWDGFARYYWKNGEKFYQLNGKVGAEDFAEDDVNVNAYDVEVFTVKFVRGPSRWETTTRSNGETVVRMIG